MWQLKRLSHNSNMKRVSLAHLVVIATAIVCRFRPTHPKDKISVLARFRPGDRLHHLKRGRFS